MPGNAGRTWVATGTSGSDVSTDGGETWETMGEVGYNTMSFASAPCAAWAAGPDGRLAKLTD